MNDIQNKYIGKYVKITKLESLNEKSSQNAYTQSLENENWWGEGFIQLFDSFLYIFRIRNYNYPNGKIGYFHTSKIQNIEELKENVDGVDKKYLIILTNDPKYRVEEVEEFKIKFDIVDVY